MNKERRTRIDSNAAAIAVMGAATREIEPPRNVKLTKVEISFFLSITRELPKLEWSDHQLETAALLARAMASLDAEQKALRTEGSIYRDRFGDPKANPRAGLVSKLMSSIVAMRRSLSIHARALQGEARDVAKRRGIALDIEADNPLEDDLLARPT